MSNFYTVQQLKQDVNANLPGNGISNIKSFQLSADKARRSLIGKMRPEELIRRAYLEEALYPDVNKYAVPDDMKYDDVIEIYRLAGYRNVDTLEHPMTLVYRRRFGQKRSSAANVMNIGYENGIKYARLFRPTGYQTPYNANQSNSSNFAYRVIDNCDSLNDNGTWNVSGNIVNLQSDRLKHVIGRASFSFDINDSTNVGTLSNFTLTPFDLSQFLQRGAVFAWLNIPLPKELLAVRLTMGSNLSDLSTDLYEATVNQPHDNNEFTDGWNLLKWMLQNLSMVGTPNPAALAYIQFEFTTTGKPIPGCNIDNIIARQGTVYEMVYNGSYIFRDAYTGAWKKFTTDNSDIIVAEEDTYDLLVDETTLAVMRESYKALPAAQSKIEAIGVVLTAKYAKFKMEHKSEGIMQSDSIHIFGNEYDGYSDDLEVGFGNQYGQYGSNGEQSPNSGASIIG